ncbi:alpha-amylase family glycosyl hydrolase [Longimicrobium sp.]|uniref:alpha-amylase family glycosyl hydrolase n=1 Tax=Longimicrobium sp. TaxID=2029185 RepID=UPI002E32EC8C|nr:alpha-amylase family glycosyl hydrolase [Longimicrobium sp.]HEX6041747.1 alpha-amylase family glycosyl hydrolase [Longimicrobium sp.]
MTVIRPSAARRIALLGAAVASAAAAPLAAQSQAAEWTRGATCYEVFVRSFQDSDGDGVGDLNGLIQRLDYINDGDPDRQDDLGAQCIWLMPIAESPSYHGYDVVDYYAVDREYGTADDFKRLMAEAHRRGIHVLVDLVLNHSSSDHPWFQEALRDPRSRYRSWYIFSPTHPGVRNPWGSDNWHATPDSSAYYFGLFWRGMPDLNVENPEVVAETRRIADFWINEMGVDGFRLDAIRHLVEGGRGAQVEHQPGTHVFLRDWAAHVARVKPDAYTVGEVWDSIGAILPYYPDQLTSHFMFELSDDILEAVNTGNASGLLGGYLRMQDTLPPHRWSPFLRNHDQSRTMTVLGGDARKARLASALLLTLPGLPFVYYGEEIGISGDKPDENLRTPMQWTSAPGGGFTTGTPWRAPQADWATRNVAAQSAESASLLTLHRRLIHLRARHPALAVGQLVPLTASHPAVAAFLRRDGDHAVLVVANLGAEPLNGVSLSSSAGAAPRSNGPGNNLFGGRAPAPLMVGADGRIQDYVPFAMLGPMDVQVVELAPAR